MYLLVLHVFVPIPPCSVVVRPNTPLCFCGCALLFYYKCSTTSLGRLGTTHCWHYPTFGALQSFCATFLTLITFNTLVAWKAIKAVVTVLVILVPGPSESPSCRLWKFLIFLPAFSTRHLIIVPCFCTTILGHKTSGHGSGGSPFYYEWFFVEELWMWICIVKAHH